MQHEEILNKVHEALEAKSLNFKAKMVETFALVDGVYVPTGKYVSLVNSHDGSRSLQLLVTPYRFSARTKFPRRWVKPAGTIGLSAFTTTSAARDACVKLQLL